MNILIGADPELFAMQDGKHVSGWGLVPGDKANPHVVDYGAVQVDGMALEFNIDPADTEDGFVFNLQAVMAQLRDMVPTHDVVADPVARFTPEYLDAQPEEAKELGCDPDYNAWLGGKVNPKPDNNLPIRTGAGHVHIGLTSGQDPTHRDHVALCCRLVRQLDFFLGLPSLLFDQDVDRRSMYGQAGAYRPKSYGVEYRVLSNKWLSDEKLMRWVFTNTTLAIQSLRDGDLAEEFGDIQEVINTSNVDAAVELINIIGIPTPGGY
jgi:hypothetical protein